MKEEVILKLSKLAKLDFDEKIQNELVLELDEMIQMVESISQVDTDGIEPLIYMHQDTIHPRDDNHVVEPLGRDQALKNAPIELNNFFVVPKVITN